MAMLVGRCTCWGWEEAWFSSPVDVLGAIEVEYICCDVVPGADTHGLVK
jgi:hypothetical protein